MCNADFKLETDQLIDELNEGDTFEINFGEVHTPGKFYITHIERMQLLQDMMSDLKCVYSTPRAYLVLRIQCLTKLLRLQ